MIGLTLALFSVPVLVAQDAPNGGQYGPEARSGYDQRGNAQAEPLSVQDIEQLVAPIALYPDALVAQVLAASTYPEQVAAADRWRQGQGYASSEEIAARADAQPWDPSVKALTAFPQVLAQMDQNLHWTSALGEAYYNQPQDAIEAVQVMRRRAQQAGNLNSTPQEAVSYDQGNIVVAPVNPQVVYVPAYNPWSVYGQPVSPYPGFSVLGALGSVFNSSAVRFGLGIAMNAFTHTPWGWLGWGLSWLTQSVLFQGSDYFSRSNTIADWGLPHGGPRAFPRGRGFANGANRSYRPGYDSSDRTSPTPSSRSSFGTSLGTSLGAPYRRASDYRRSGGAYSGTRSNEFARTPRGDVNAGKRNGEPYSRGYQTARNAYGRTSQPAHNRFQPAVGRSRQYGRSSYGSGFNPRPVENDRGRPSTSYGNSMRSYSAPGASLQRSDFGRQSSRSFARNDFSKSSGKSSHSGFHWFGGRHEPKSFGGGKSFSAKAFRPRRSGGGGHSGGRGHSGGKHRR